MRGTLVHAVLEKLYDLPAAERSPAAARRRSSPAPGRSCARSPESPSCSPRTDGRGPTGRAGSLEAWLASAGRLVETLLHAGGPDAASSRTAARSWSRSPSPTGCCCAGSSTGIDVAPNGALRVVDYKTGAMPREAFEAKALFQMKFYALVLWRTRGVVASQLKLLYLGDGDALTYAPDEAELIRFERTLQAIWTAIERAVATGDFRPSPSRLCGWCDHQALCPSFGGTPPPFPAEAAAAAGWETTAGRRAGLTEGSRPVVPPPGPAEHQARVPGASGLRRRAGAARRRAGPGRRRRGSSPSSPARRRLPRTARSRTSADATLLPA